MLATHPPDVTDRFTRCFIRRTARGLIAKGPFKLGDLDDLVQDLTLDLIERAPQFDPERARWTTFVKTVVERKAISLLRHHDAACRKGQQDVRSLDVLIEEEDGRLVSLATTVSEDEYEAGCCREQHDDLDRSSLRFDVQAALASLPEDLCAIARLLLDRSVSEAARELGIPRTTLTDRVRKIREHFAAAGLAEYL